MKQLLLAVFLLSSVSVFGQESELPNDANRKQLIVIAPGDSHVIEWFSSNLKLRTVKLATQFSHIDPVKNKVLYESRYADAFGDKYPIVAYQRPDGGLIYYADRDTMPSTSESLYSEMAGAAIMARNAIPANDVPTRESPMQQMESDDCLDGTCPLPGSEKPRFPRLPFNRDRDDPFANVAGGWFSDSVSSGIWLVFSILALGVVLLFAVLIFGAMIVVVRWIK